MFKGNKWLAVGVVAVSAIAVGLYVYRFWGKPLSTDPGDWADFATYLSGTVGVAAVVATLLAFVKTLGQQQALIDSQDEMLIEQRRQITLTEKQNFELEKKHKIEISYSNVREIFPALVLSLSAWRKCDMSPYSSKEPGLRSNFLLNFESNKRSADYLMINPLYLMNVFKASEPDEVKSYMVRFFRPIDRLYCFMCQQISNSSILFEYFDSKLWVDEGHDNTKFFFHCYQAYLVGRGNRLYLEGAGFLELNSDYSDVSNDVLKGWQELGEYISCCSDSNE